MENQEKKAQVGKRIQESGFQIFKKMCLRLCGSGSDLMVSGPGSSRQCKSDCQPRAGEYRVERLLLPLGSHTGEVKGVVGRM